MLKNISKITVINLLAQIISVIGFTINAQLYGAENIGGLLVVLSYSSIISIVSSGYFEQAFFITKNANQKKHLFILILYILSSVCLASGFILNLFGILYIIFIVLNIFSTSLIKTSDTYFISENKIMSISLYKLLFSPVIPLGYYISYTYIGANENSLIYINSISNLFFAIILSFLTSFSFREKMVFRDFLKFRLFFLLFFRYSKFIKFSMTGELFRTIAFKGPTIVLEKFFGKEIAGFYGIAHRIALMPTLILVGTVSQIYIQKISFLKKANEAMSEITGNVLKTLTILSLIGIFLFLIFGESLIVGLLGVAFRDVFTVIIALIPYALAIIIFSPIFSVFTVFERQEFLFSLKFIILVLSFISFGFSVLARDFISGLTIFSYLLLTAYSVYAYFGYRIIRQHDKKTHKIFIS